MVISTTSAAAVEIADAQLVSTSTSLALQDHQVTNAAINEPDEGATESDRGLRINDIEELQSETCENKHSCHIL